MIWLFVLLTLSFIAAALWVRRLNKPGISTNASASEKETSAPANRR